MPTRQLFRIVLVGCGRIAKNHSTPFANRRLSVAACVRVKSGASGRCAARDSWYSRTKTARRGGSDISMRRGRISSGAGGSRQGRPPRRHGKAKAISKGCRRLFQAAMRQVSIVRRHAEPAHAPVQILKRAVYRVVRRLYLANCTYVDPRREYTSRRCAELGSSMAARSESGFAYVDCPVDRRTVENVMAKQRPRRKIETDATGVPSCVQSGALSLSGDMLLPTEQECSLRFRREGPAKLRNRVNKVNTGFADTNDDELITTSTNPPNVYCFGTRATMETCLPCPGDASRHCGAAGESLWSSSSASTSRETDATCRSLCGLTAIFQGYEQNRRPAS